MIQEKQGETQPRFEASPGVVEGLLDPHRHTHTPAHTYTSTDVHRHGPHVSSGICAHSRCMCTHIHSLHRHGPRVSSNMYTLSRYTCTHTDIYTNKQAPHVNTLTQTHLRTDGPTCIVDTRGHMQANTDTEILIHGHTCTVCPSPTSCPPC